MSELPDKTRGISSHDNGAFQFIESDFNVTNQVLEEVICPQDKECFRENIGLGTHYSAQRAQMDLFNSAHKSSSKLICPVCHGSSSAFYCKECVCNGNFYHSSVKFPERFAEKRLRERRLRHYVESLEENAPKKVSSLKKRDSLKDEIENVKKRVTLMKEVIESEKSKLRKVHEEERDIRFLIYHLQKAHSGFLKKNEGIMLKMNRYKQRIPDKKRELENLEGQTKILASEKVKSLISTIFPIREISQDRSEGVFSDGSDSVNEETVKGLTEALQTHYVRGKWITSSHFTQTKNYSILLIPLPGSGQYSSILKQNFMEGVEKKESRNICAGLAYLCQMVNVLASILDIYLPKRLSFKDFTDVCMEESSHKKFLKLVLKLNANVLYLCVAQGVSSAALHPMRPLQNLLALLTDGKADIGRRGSFEFVDSILDTLEDTGDCGELPESDSDSDWETLPSVAVPECLPPSSPPVASFLRRHSVDETASGLVTSAAASVMSIFRGIGGTLHK